jgi:hypothetical protein
MDKTTKPQVNGYFGLCPECHNNDGYLDVGRDHWFFCEEHKVKWWAGSNLFSSWCEQTEEGKQANIKFLEGCRIVEPIWPANTFAENAAKKETKYPPSDDEFDGLVAAAVPSTS